MLADNLGKMCANSAQREYPLCLDKRQFGCKLMNWIEKAAQLFKVKKPEHFTDYQHCCECFDHDQTLLTHDVESIGFDELGNPGWDPLCYVDPIGFTYYFPAFVRLCWQSDEENYYISQFLFHLIYDGQNNRYVQAFKQNQRQFVVQFLGYLLEDKTELIERFGDADDLFLAFEIWTKKE